MTHVFVVGHILSLVDRSGVALCPTKEVTYGLYCVCIVRFLS